MLEVDLQLSHEHQCLEKKILKLAYRCLVRVQETAVVRAKIQLIWCIIVLKFC